MVLDDITNEVVSSVGSDNDGLESLQSSDNDDNASSHSSDYNVNPFECRRARITYARNTTNNNKRGRRKRYRKKDTLVAEDTNNNNNDESSDDDETKIKVCKNPEYRKLSRMYEMHKRPMKKKQKTSRYTSGTKKKLFIKHTVANNPTPTTTRNGLTNISSTVFSENKYTKREISKERVRTGQPHTKGGLRDRKVRYDVTKLANDLAATDCENPRKTPTIPP
eukprot:259301_1